MNDESMTEAMGMPEAEDARVPAMMPEGHWEQRTVQLLGEEGVNRLRRARVLVVGLGGVGAAVAEMLCRAGIGHLTLVDGDLIRASNINRQLPALTSTVGEWKSEVVARRLLDINPNCSITALREFLRDERTAQVLAGEYDYVADAIDTLAPKVYLMAECVRREIPIVSSMGAGGKLDPAQIGVADLKDSCHCKLAAALRKRLRRLGVSEGVTVVFSTESVPASAVLAVQEQNKKSTLGTISYIPTVFGCQMASVIVRQLVE